MDVNRAVVLSFAFLATFTLATAAGIVGIGERVDAMRGQLPAGGLRTPGRPSSNRGPLGAGSLLPALLGGPGLKQGDMTRMTCDTSCPSSHCCLLRPGESRPSCRPVVLSGRPCSWHHCNMQKNPNPAQAVYGNTCPCLLGMCCLGSRGLNSFNGVCSFL